jgi:His-Xaa-Ser system radical SAM maturase HxsC
MLLKTKGTPLNIQKHLVGKVTRHIDNLDRNTFLIIENTSKYELPETDFLGVLTTLQEYKQIVKGYVVYNIPSLLHLEDGDIVSVGNDGKINTLYRINSQHNTLLTTERCNSNCLMCSQPPRDRNDIPILFDIHSQLIPLIPKDCLELGISGGEPTLMGELFFSLMEQLKEQLPNTEIHVLTNGRSFAWNQMAERLGQIDNPKLMLGIPVYSDYYQVHDYIVQAENAFYQTIIGLHNLARYGQRLEVRIVLHKETIPRLTKLAEYIYKNLPFVEHIAFMGLEYIGYTPFNIDKLWIDPYEYKEELTESVEFLAEKGMHVSIYNTPLCLLPESIWKYARKSISDWKNEYLPECRKCYKINECGGLFTWNLKKHSEYIKPLVP